LDVSWFDVDLSVEVDINLSTVAQGKWRREHGGVDMIVLKLPVCSDYRNTKTESPTRGGEEDGSTANDEQMTIQI
jgi:hypothetical protein